MKSSSKYAVDLGILFSIIIFAIISIITIGSAQKLLTVESNLMIKQIIWYLISFGLAFVVMTLGNNFLYKNAWIFYIVGVVSLIAVLIFGATINDAKCWFIIPGIGSLQPSEFMKIFLIIALGRLINDFKENYDNPSVFEEFKFLLKIGVVVGVPSILTFLQPDTGVVLIYLLITLIMLFISGIRYRWFAIIFGIAGFILGFILLMYFCFNSTFIKIFGSSLFLRLDRLFDWSKGSGYQLKNGMTAIGSGGLFGYGFFNTPIYFPYPQTDFIFAVFSNNTGLIGATFLLILILYFDLKLINLAIESPNNTNKYVIAGIIGMLIYQQFQNIGMTLGLMPITGITLPFISYGGSSLLSYMIMAGLIFSISNENIRYRN